MDGGRHQAAVNSSAGRLRVDVALGLVAVALRALALGAAVLGGRFPEFWEYEYIARNLLDGRGFVFPHMGGEYHAYAEPLYPWLVAAVYAVSGRSVLALGLAHCALSALVAPVIYHFARRTFGDRAALLAGLLVALHPGLVGYAVKFHPVVLDVLFMALVALAFLQLVEAPTRGRAVVLGLAVGLCVLTRPTVLAFVTVALVWAAWRPAAPRLAGRLLLAVAIAAVVVAPWVVRNYVVVGGFVLTRSNTPFVFWLGNHPGTTGGATNPNESAGTSSLFNLAPPELQRQVLDAPDELAKNRVFRDEALAYVRAAPGAFVGRTLRKLYYFWWFAPYQGRRYSSWQFTVYAAYYAGALALAVVGLLATPRARPQGVTIIVLLLASVSSAQALFYIEGRHRLVVEPLLLVLSGAGLATLAARLSGAAGGRREGTAPPVG